MKKHSMYPLLVLVTALFCSRASCAGEASPEQCERLRERIEKYDSLRRGGGSGSQMAAWKRAREAAKKAYRKHRCHMLKRRMIVIKGSG